MQKIIAYVIIAIAIVAYVIYVLRRKPEALTRESAAEFIENFLEGEGDMWDWDEFTTNPSPDPVLRSIQQECAGIPDRYPPGEGEVYCNADGEKLMRQLIEILRDDKMYEDHMERHFNR